MLEKLKKIIDKHQVISFDVFDMWQYNYPDGP